MRRYDLLPATDSSSTHIAHPRSRNTPKFHSPSALKSTKLVMGYHHRRIVTLYVLIIKPNELPANYHVIGHSIYVTNLTSRLYTVLDYLESLTYENKIVEIS